MGFRIITDEERSQILIHSFTENFENVNPIDYLNEQLTDIYVKQILYFAQHDKSIFGWIIRNAPPRIQKAGLTKWAIEQVGKTLSSIHNNPYPKELDNLLSNPRKKDQVRLLKGVRLNPESLMHFILGAYEKHGYVYSQYITEHKATDTNTELMPKAVFVEGEKVEKFGRTTLSDGQLKHAVKHRTVIIAKVLDKGENWHCFFYTFDGILGKERHLGGVKHMHYISDKWGLSRAEVIKQLKSKKYSLPSTPHIEYEES